MEEKEIDKILKPKNKLIILLLIYLSIAFLCIGLVLFMKFTNKEEEIVNLSEITSSYNEKEGQCVKLDCDSLPILMMPSSKKDNQFYYLKDVSNNIYIVSLSNETFNNIIETTNKETGKLNSTYQLKGIITSIDEQIRNLALSNSNKVFEGNKLNLDNFSEYLGDFYIKEKVVGERTLTLYKISVLAGVFFLIIALGYILPNIIKVNKNFNNKELIDELRVELGNLTDTPYKEQHIYLTQKYIVSGIQTIKYEDIIWGYILQEYKYGIKVGENLIVHTKDNKKHIIGSVAGTKNNILDNILNDINSRNTNIRVGYSKENKDFFEKHKNVLDEN